MEKTNNFKKDGFYITTPEFALMLGISTEALRSRRRRGEYKGQYVFNGKDYLWSGLGPNQVKEAQNNRLKIGRRLTLDSSSVAVVRGRSARARRRGITEQGTRTNYPNQAFKNKNDARMFARITKGKDVNFLNRITDKTIDVAQKEMQQDALKKTDIFKPIKNYGMGIYDARNEPISNKIIKWSDEIEDEEKDFWSNKYY